LISVGNKLALLIPILPLSVLVVAFGIGFYSYRSSLDASAFATMVSSLLSAFVVVLLVWERLRDSLFEKLKYVHKNFLFDLYTEFSNENFFYAQDKTKKLRLGLERYGKFIFFISLYPRGLLNRIDEYLSVHEEFYPRWKRIQEIYEKTRTSSMTFSNYDFAQFLGIDLNYRSQITAEQEKQYEDVQQAVSRENPQLIPETKTYLEMTIKLKEKNLGLLRDFLMSNNLPIEPSFNKWG
jgi:hypothetical protein